jgi:hypothetical protein
MNQARLKELYNYQPNGSLTFAVRSSNRVRVGDTVGALSHKGYLHTTIDGQKQYLHRMVWVWHNGPIPEGLQVDHINGVKGDNRIENLQLLNNRQNVAKGMAVWKPGGLPAGVRWKPNRCKFYAAIHDQAIGKQRHLGSFNTAEEASAAYQLALEAIT